MTSPLFILYGSATGNAEHIAKDLAATYESLLQNPDADTFFSSVVCCEMDQYKKRGQPVWDEAPTATDQAKHGLLIVTSTTGNGDSPENASRLVRYLKRKTTVDAQPFRHCAYAVLALGDTNYDQFCFCGKVVDKKIGTLGGTRALSVTCADEGTGLEDVVDPWTATILTHITRACRNEGTSSSAEEEGKEEKKEEAEEPTVAVPVGVVPSPVVSTPVAPEPVAPAPTVEETILTSSSTGVSMVRALLEANQSVEAVPAAALPSMTASRLSSFALVEDEDKETEGRPRSESVSTTSSAGYHYTFQHPFSATVRSARYLTQTSTCGESPADHQCLADVTAHLHQEFPLLGEAAHRNGKRVLEIEVNLPDEFFDYEPGDAIGMVVENAAADVSYVLEQLHTHYGLLPQQKMSLDTQRPVTVEEAITKQIDMTWLPLKNKRILYSLAQQAEGEEARVLEWLSSTAGEEVYQKFIVQQRRSVCDLLREFPSLQKIPVQALLGILPALPPRYYSITSSPLVSKTSLTIALAVVDYLTPSLMIDGKEQGRRRIGGLVSQFLESLVFPLSSSFSSAPATSLPIFPKPTSEFRLPSSMTTPLVLIGPGTGVAPFVGFLQHRRALLQADDAGQAASTIVEGTWRGGMEMDEDALAKETQGLRVGVDYRESQGQAGSVDVFFGCRHFDHDFLYQTELEELREAGILTKLHTAFSRQGPEKVYVQDLMCACEHLTDLLVKQGAAVYICGDGNHMAKAVQGAIQSLLEKELGKDAAATFLTKMKEEKRLLLDIWS
jgi:sulfite reductase alpha subunit-like flavoprotein